MANMTIYGCVNFTTGAVVFEGYACDAGNYTGCVYFTGVHAGQVAITFSETNCDSDTYYGCVNFATGKFQVLIPDDCCDDGTYCSCCDDNGPGTIDVTASFGACCLTTMSRLNPGFNGIYACPSLVDGCIWEYEDEDDGGESTYGSTTHWPLGQTCPDGTGSSTGYTFNYITVGVNWRPLGLCHEDELPFFFLQIEDTDYSYSIAVAARTNAMGDSGSCETWIASADSIDFPSIAETCSGGSMSCAPG